MKTRIIGFILALIAMASVIVVNAQNGGQLNENPSAKMELVNVYNGVTTLKITNKQDCTADIQTKAPNVTRVKSYAPLASDTIQLIGLVGSEVKIQCKTLTSCGGGNFGQIELLLNINDLPVRITNIRVKLKYEHYQAIK